MKEQLETERKQLLDHWAKRLRRSPDLAFTQVRRIWAACQGVVFDGPPALLDDDLRHFHDKLGYMSKLTVARGGLCAGAIYRTDRFIKTDERIGSKQGQTVHIEHTYPIKELRVELGKRTFRTYAEVLSWLLKYSVATAFHEDEKAHLKGVSSNSNALNPISADYLKPFARYSKLHRSEGIVWNVFDRRRVDPLQLTFDDHFDTVLRLMKEAGASERLISDIRECSPSHIDEHTYRPE